MTSEGLGTLFMFGMGLFAAIGIFAVIVFVGLEVDERRQKAAHQALRAAKGAQMASIGYRPASIIPTRLMPGDRQLVHSSKPYMAVTLEDGSIMEVMCDRALIIAGDGDQARPRKPADYGWRIDRG